MMGHYWNWGWGAFGVMNILMLLFWVALLLLGIWLVTRLFPKTGATPPTGPARSGESALDILQRRFAQGDISKAEYQEMRREIGG